MQFDFESIMDRRGHDAMALDALGHAAGFAPEEPEEGFDAIPMWVADMNFPTAPSITAALEERIRHPAYGYFLTSPKYYDAIVRWHATRHGVEGLSRRHIGYENGVLGGLVSTLSACAERGSPVLLHSPTYIGFTHAIEDAGYRIVLSPLYRDEAGVWRMDYGDMDEKLGEEGAKLAVFCSPHNPCGRVWERWEIERAMEVYASHGCTVVSDEIWSDLVLPGHVHVPTQSIGEDARRRTVALYAPSKTFNLAGLVGSYHVIYDDCLRERVEAQASKSHYNDMNVLSMHALIGAYSPEGAEWVDELRQVLGENVDFACDWFAQNAPGVDLAKPEGTYMLFLDCTGWCESHGCSLDDLLAAGWRVGVGWQDGRPFHGPCHIRMNLALPHARVREAFKRLGESVFVG